MSRVRRSSPTSRMLVVFGVLTVLGLTFGAGVFVGRMWQARSVVVPARVAEEPVRRGLSRPGRPDQPSPQLTFYQELTAPLTAPPPPPKPAKTTPPPLVTLPPPTAASAPASAQRPGEQADVLAAVARTAVATPMAGGTRFTIQVASYRLRPPAEALRDSLTAAGHEARVVEAESNGAVYRVQVGEFATRDAARAAAARFGGTPYITTR